MSPARPVATAAPIGISDRTKSLAFAFFFLSGACGLIYEVVWMRLLGLLMGHTVHSVTTVLTAFMGGLALGSWLAGRVVDSPWGTRHPNRPLLIYGVLEGAIGLYCALLPHLIEAAEPLFRVIYQRWHGSFELFNLFRFLVCGSLLLIPTTFMGATLPALSRYLVARQETLGLTVGRLYALNTFGAVFGSFGAGVLLIPEFGMRLTTYGAALVNIVIALAVFALARKPTASPVSPVSGPSSPIPHPPCQGDADHRPPTTDHPVPLSRRAAAVLLIAFGLSGFSAMVYQVAWTNALALVIGSSTYAFSLIVTAFIAGLAIGSVLAAQVADRETLLGGDRLLALGAVQAGIGLASALVVALLGAMPLLIVPVVVNLHRSFALLLTVEFLVVFLLVLAPTILMGATFPLVAKVYVRNLRRLGEFIGNAYAANTVGAILGSASVGFLLIPRLGVQNAIYVAVTLNVLVACALILMSKASTPALRRLLCLLLLGVEATFYLRVPAWDRIVMTSGPYLYALEVAPAQVPRFRDIARTWRGEADLQFYKEEMGAVVSVMRTVDGVFFLRINGKNDASSFGDMPTQQLLVHLPMLLHPNPDRLLLIGLGSGVSVGVAERYPLKQIDCVEISRAVIEAAEFFRPFSHSDPNDPRVRVLVGDGRSHVALTAEKYDLILSQPSNPWISGIASLFTVDFFERCKARLAPGGLVCAWFHSYGMSPEDFRMIVNTFRSVFPRVTLWEPAYADYLLIGSDRDVLLDYEAVAARMADPRLKSAFQELLIADPLDLLTFVVFGPEGARDYCRGAALNTDDNAALEFSAPRNLYRPSSPLELAPHFDPKWAESVLLKLPAGHARPQGLERLPTILESRAYTLVGQEMAGMRPATGLETALRTALDKNPRNLVASRFLAWHHLEEGNRLLRRGAQEADKERQEARFEEAADHFRAAVQACPSHARAHSELGSAFFNMGRYDEAIAKYQDAIGINPNDAAAHLGLGASCFWKTEYDQAISALTRATRLCPNYLKARLFLAHAYAKAEKWREAAQSWREVLRLSPDDPEALERLTFAEQKAEATSATSGASL